LQEYPDKKYFRLFNLLEGYEDRTSSPTHPIQRWVPVPTPLHDEAQCRKLHDTFCQSCAPPPKIPYEPVYRSQTSRRRTSVGIIGSSHERGVLRWSSCGLIGPESDNEGDSLKVRGLPSTPIRWTNDIKKKIGRRGGRGTSGVDLPCRCRR